MEFINRLRPTVAVIFAVCVSLVAAATPSHLVAQIQAEGGFMLAQATVEPFEQRRQAPEPEQGIDLGQNEECLARLDPTVRSSAFGQSLCRTEQSRIRHPSPAFGTLSVGSGGGWGG